jgi:hypothetical protein
MVDEAWSFGPLAKNGKQVKVRKGHELGMKITWKKKRDPPTSGLNVDEDINL